MKKSLFTGIAVLISLSAATAQTEKGRLTVGTSVGNFQYSSQNGNNSFSGSISPSAGYFVANNLTVGMGLPLGLSTSSTSGYKYVSTVIGVSPFIRYYFGSKTLRPYIGIAYAYSTNRQHSENNPQATNQVTTATGYTSSTSPVVGVAYFINRTVAVNAGLSYVWQRYKYKSTNYNAAGNPIDLPASTSEYLTFGIGFQLYFGK